MKTFSAITVAHIEVQAEDENEAGEVIDRFFEEPMIVSEEVRSEPQEPQVNAIRWTSQIEEKEQ